jgi:serine/threonine protein kinase
VQGPKSKDVIAALFGDAVLDIKYYWTLTTDLDGIPVVISRTGWTGEVGYEIYLRDPSRGGELWDRIMEAGRPHAIRPIAPCEARRIEAGIFNYGSDMTIENNPFEIMGLERLVAIKLLDPTRAAEPSTIESFKREARVLAEVRHPNVVQVHAFGRHPPLLYLAMEYIEGSNLQDLIESHAERGACPCRDAQPFSS